MPKFVVSYISFYGNNLQSEVVQGDTWEDALLNSSFELACLLEEDVFSLEEVKQRAFDRDSMINVIEI